MFQILLSGVQQGFIVGSMFFNIFINDLFYFIKDVQLLNDADDKKITAFSNSVDDLITDLQQESENATDWFRSNKMAVNPDKFQYIIINRFGELKDSYELIINNHKIDSETLLDIKTDNKLNFEKGVTALCQKPGRQLNALSHINKYTGFRVMKMFTW